jgi:hypothetical protein
MQATAERTGVIPVRRPDGRDGTLAFEADPGGRRREWVVRVVDQDGRAVELDVEADDVPGVRRALAHHYRVVAV